MSYSNRELVVFFINYKLSQRNYPTCQLGLEDASERTEGDDADAVISNGSLANSRTGSGQPGTPSPPNGGIEVVKAALQDSADEFELRYTQAFSSLSSQLHITPATAYHSFESVMDEVFRNGVNWGRVVGLFAFGGALCVECVERDMNQLVPRIADWMTTYLDNHIEPWIQREGGWVSRQRNQPKDAVFMASVRGGEKKSIQLSIATLFFNYYYLICGYQTCHSRLSAMGQKNAPKLGLILLREKLAWPFSRGSLGPSLQDIQDKWVLWVLMGLPFADMPTVC